MISTYLWGRKKRYFLYVSPTKVEMLHSQLGVSYLGKLKAGLKLKLLVAEASVEGETTTRALCNKAEEIRNHLLADGKAGTIDKPKAYIDDVAELSFGNIIEYASSMAYFGGIINGKKVALLGDASSLVGGVPSVEANHAPYYYTMRFINEMLDSGKKIGETKIPYVKSLEEAVDIAQSAVKTPPERLIFTAMVLYDSPRLLVASPIFVAKAE